MKNTFRRIAALLALAICLCGVAVLATACDDDEPATGGYTVTVTYPNGDKVDGNTGTGGMEGNKVTVLLCVTKANGELGACLLPKELGADGKVTFTNSDLTIALGEGEKYHVAVNDLPQGYTCPDNYYMDKPGELTVVLQAA